MATSKRSLEAPTEAGAETVAERSEASLIINCELRIEILRRFAPQNDNKNLNLLSF